MKILFKFASRSRPEKFFNCLNNIYANVKSDDFVILAAVDEDDKTMNNAEVIDAMKNYDKLVVTWGASESKIHAVNRGIETVSDWDILVNTSDDMWFNEKEFDEVIRQDMATHFPDLDGVLHYNDGNQKNNVMTLSIMGRKYYQRFGYIYHPSYLSLWSDVEATMVARIMGKYEYMGDNKIIFRHLHPAWGLAAFDEQYRKTEDRMMWQKDEATFRRREIHNFHISGK